MNNIRSFTTPLNGDVVEVDLDTRGDMIRTVIAFSGRSTGTVTIRTKTIGGDFETPDTPNSVDLSAKKSIYFYGEPLEAVELTDGGSGVVTVTVTQTNI